MSSGDSAELYVSRRDSRFALFATRSRVIEYIWPTTASTSGRILMREATESRWTKSSLACWRLKVRTERQVIPFSAFTLGGRMTWAGVIGCSTIVHKVSLVLGGRRESVGDGEGDKSGTVAGSALAAEISAAEAGTDNGGELPYSDFTVRG